MAGQHTPCAHASSTICGLGVGSPCCRGRLSDFASSIVRCWLPNYYDERDRAHVERRLTHRLEQLGYRVTLEPRAA